MAIASKEEITQRLMACTGHPELKSAKQNLNIELRENLRVFASVYNLQFEQDSVGNIYVMCRGRDEDLAPIALTFPLDLKSANRRAATAIQAFISLQKVEMSCGVTLLAWSSPGGEAIGREAFEGTALESAVHDRAPELQEYASMKKSSEFSLSAIFEIDEVDNEALTICGSQVLMAAASKIGDKMGVSFRTTSDGPTSRRVPIVRLQGGGAMKLSLAVIEHYSAYVAALFENFD